MGISIGSILRTLRWSDWAQSKIPMLCSASAYVCLTHESVSGFSVFKVIVFLFFFASSNAAFGFLINDLADLEIDRKQSKKNVFAETSKFMPFTLLTAVFAVMVISGMPFYRNLGFLPLWLAFLLTSVAYSLPPLRLKTKGWSGLLVSTVAQCSIPLALACIAQSPESVREPGALVLILGGTIAGFSLELAHQRFDRSKDASTGTTTFAVRLQERSLDRLCWWTFWVDRLAVGAILFVVVLSATFLLSQWIGGLLILMFLGAVLNIMIRLMKGQAIDPYYAQRNLADRFVHHLLPGIIIPVFLLASLSMESIVWLIPLALFLAWKLLLPTAQ
jgi:4-hydroxybenzoate polyprenyltransferase